MTATSVGLGVVHYFIEQGVFVFAARGDLRRELMQRFFVEGQRFDLQKAGDIGIAFDGVDRFKLFKRDADFVW